MVLSPVLNFYVLKEMRINYSQVIGDLEMMRTGAAQHSEKGDTPRLQKNKVEEDELFCMFAMF